MSLEHPQMACPVPSKQLLDVSLSTEQPARPLPLKLGRVTCVLRACDSSRQPPGEIRGLLQHPPLSLPPLVHHLQATLAFYVPQTGWRGLISLACVQVSLQTLPLREACRDDFLLRLLSLSTTSLYDSSCTAPTTGRGFVLNLIRL